MPKVIILIGPPGAGKGTQGQLLSEKYGFYYFETSKILEEAFSSHKKGEFLKVGKEKYFFDREKKLWQEGKLCSPPFVVKLVKEKIKKLYRQRESIVFSGSPRTLFEAEQEIPLLEKTYGRENIKVILIDIPARETIFRNSHRRICALLRHPILYSPETKNLKICPLDGSKLLRREGLDDPATIKVRLEEYKQRTLPIIDYLKKRNITVKKINGVGTVSQVFQRIEKAIR